MHVDTDSPIPMNSWTTIEISQLLQPDINRYKYSIKVGGSVNFDVFNNDAREFTNVTAYIASDLFSHPPAVARIDNLNVTTFPDEDFSVTEDYEPQVVEPVSEGDTERGSIMPDTQQIVKTFPKLYKQWIVSFDFKPTGKASDSRYANVFHMTTDDSTYGTYGYMTPTVFWEQTDNTMQIYRDCFRLELLYCIR